MTLSIATAVTIHDAKYVFGTYLILILSLLGLFLLCDFKKGWNIRHLFALVC